MALFSVPPELKNVLQILIDEIEDHRTTLAPCLNPTPAVVIEHTEYFTTRFHRIKGGAGFLALNEIEEVSKAAELLLREQGKSPTDETCLKLKQLTEKLFSYFDELQAETKV